LYDQKKLAVVEDVVRPVRMRNASGTPGEIMARTYSALRFLPHGFVTLEWAARAADIDPLTGTGAYTFDTGVSLLAPGANCPGDSFEHSSVRNVTRALRPLRTPFPNSSLGRQLEDVSRLIRVAPALGMEQQVLFVGTAGMSRSAAKAGTLVERHRELAKALAAFFAATVELGVESSVTTYTDGDFTPRSTGRGTRMVLGGSVLSKYASGISQDSYAGAMASWLGVDDRNVRAHFPEFEPTVFAAMA